MLIEYRWDILGRYDGTGGQRVCWATVRLVGGPIISEYGATEAYARAGLLMRLAVLEREQTPGAALAILERGRA